MCCLNKSKSGFTLIELSIVLVIIGLLVGGVLLGRDLIRAAEIRAHFKLTEEIITGINTFKLKYNALPGDMDNTTDYWSGTPCSNIVAPRNCNGNGDGLISVNYEEGVFGWKQLELAGLIKGGYSGAWVPGMVPGEDVPTTPLGSGYGMIIDYREMGGGGYYGHISTGHYIWTQVFAGTAGYYGSANGGLDGLALYAIDQKFDDGMPLTGSILTWTHTNCITGSEYDLTNGGQNCWFWQRIGL